MKKIFETAHLGALEIPNRLVRSATVERGCADNGIIADRYNTVISELAEGGVGLIITGMMGVAPNAELDPTMIKIYADDFVKKFSAVAGAVHKAGSKIVVQLGHCGAKSTFIAAGDHVFAPSDITFNNCPSAKAMTKAEIAALVKDYGKAAKQCKDAGADGVQIHGAHGYLISQFLSPYFNKRTDEYGGEIKNRARILFEAYDEIRAKTGPDFPVLIKINYTDMVEPGISPDEIRWVCKELSNRGIDAIEVSSGVSVGGDTRPSKTGFKTEGYFGEYALDIASRVSCPVIVMGGLRSIGAMEEWLNKGNIEAVALCRPFIREPKLASRWKSDPRAKPKCISCNQCYQSTVHGCYIDQHADKGVTA
jgi:2,4-dienoyl-CoA reductase-like NADH-dependent reductase (Old Yellow Enzyme family)